MRLVYSQEAVADLVRLRKFIAEKNPDTATRIAEESLTRIKQLRRFPQMGVTVEQALPPADIRDMIFGNYTVRYSGHEQALAVLRIWHHYEDRAHGA